MKNIARLLLITSDPSLEYVVKHALSKEDITAEIDKVDNEESALEIIDRGNYDCILLDYTFAELNGLSILHDVEKMEVPLPIIVTTSQGNESLAVQIMKAGATDYIPKIKIPECLAHSIQNAIRMHTAEIKAMEANALCLRLGRILDETSNEIFLFDAMTYSIQQVNMGACRNLGYTKDEIVGKLLFELAPQLTWKNLERLTQPLRLGQKTQVLHETILRRKDGSAYSAEIRLQMLEVDSLPVFVAIAQDISEKLQTSEKLKAFAEELQRSYKELEDFAAIASFNLSEPLRKIISFGNLLKSRYSNALDEVAIDYIERMQRPASKMQRLINDLLLYSRVTTKPHSWSDVNLEEVMRDVLLYDLDVKISLTGAKISTNQLPPIEADKFKIRQLFINLIDNALKFHKKSEPPVIKVDCVAVADDFYEISVQDNGVGFNEAFVDKIFKPFERLHGTLCEGSGIGLAICQKIVLQHGGQITAQSTPNVGSTFTVKLPMRQFKKVASSQWRPQNNIAPNPVTNHELKDSRIPTGV